MIFEFKPAFDRTLRGLTTHRKERARAAVAALIDFFGGGSRPAGLGLKRLRADIWEIRSGLGDRIIFHYAGDHVSFLLVGNHDEIARFLRRR